MILYILGNNWYNFFIKLYAHRWIFLTTEFHKSVCLCKLVIYSHELSIPGWLNCDYNKFCFHIHRNTYCFPTDAQHKKLNRSKPLLLESEVISTQITFGHSMNNQRACRLVQARAMNKVGDKFCSLHSTFANGLMTLTEDIFDYTGDLIILLVTESSVKSSCE